jgi:tetratricopeptide (TPR) repeat protein
MKPALRSLLLVVVALQSGRIASSHAAPSESHPPSRAEEEQARQSFARGETLFRSQKYREAAAAFEAGYRQAPSPAFLFDLALTYRALGNSQQAIGYYQQYLNAQPNAADRATVESAIADEQRKLGAAAAAAPSAAPPAASSSVPKASFEPTAVAVDSSKEPSVAFSGSDQPVEKPVWKKGWFWAATGAVVVGAVAIGLGVGLSKFGTEPYKEVTWR